MTTYTSIRNLFLVIAAGGLIACSSSSDTPATTTVSGTVFAAPVNGASVSVTDGSGNPVAGPVITTSAGAFSIAIPNTALASELVFESTGGTFTDEASGATGVHAGDMAAIAAAGTLGAGSAVHATPDTTIIHHMVMQHSMTITDAQNVFASAFGYTPDVSVEPTDATSPGTGTDDAQKLAGLRAATFSQLALDLGFSPAQQFELCAAIAQDLSDGVLDGVADTGAVSVNGVALPADIRNRFVTAMMNFRAGNDHSGLSSVQLGNLPFSTVALTDSYSLEYVAPTGMMNAMEGKSRFQIRITSRADNTPATGLDVSLMPMMYMATHEHSTPFEAVTDDDNDGTYDVTIYYLMPTSMMDGTSMGIWDLTVMIGGEVAHFYPDVMMAMGDSPRAVLKGQMVDDMIPNMSGLEEARSYYMFNEGVSATPGGHSFGLFLAARESMMNYPVVDVGATLNSGTAYELTVASISIEVSTDGSNWTAAVNDGGGHFSASGLSGMSSGVQAPLYARLSINGEQKTTDGNPPAGDGSNDIATFTVTPG